MFLEVTGLYGSVDTGDIVRDEKSHPPGPTCYLLLTGTFLNQNFSGETEKGTVVAQCVHWYSDEVGTG